MISDDLLNKTLENIKKTPVAYNYFFQNIDNAAWLLPLKEKGFFKSPIPAIRKDGYIQFPTWPESGYLLRIVDRAPNEVLEIVRVLPDTDNERVMDDVANILLKVSPRKASRHTDQIKKYINTSQFLMLHITVSELVCKLANNGQYDSALELTKSMLEVLPDPEKDEKLKSDYVMIKPSIKYRDHDYKDIVEKITPSLAKASPLATIEMYVELLQKALDYKLTFHREDGEETVLKEKKDDFSFIWRPDIAEDSEYNNDPEDILTTALRDSVVVLMGNNNIGDADKLTKLKEVATNKYSIFKRIVEFGLRGHKNKKAFKLFYDTLIKDKELKSILEGEKRGVGKITSGFVTDKATEVLKELPDTDLIEKLKTYKDESGWSFERDSISKELGVLVKLDPGRFVPLVKQIASTKNEYLDETIRAFEEAADSLDESNIDRIVTSLIEIYKTGSVVQESERHDYFSWSKSSSIKFLEKLLSQKEDKTERVTGKSLSNIRSLMLLLCRDKDPTGKSDPDFEPVDLSINSNRGKALHGIAYLLVWMRRNKVKKEQYKPIFDELDWHLKADNDPAPAMRAVYGWRFEILYGANEDWATKNIDVIFTDDESGNAAFDAYMMFNGVHPEALGILGDVFKRQMARLATAPVDDGRSRHDGLKNFVQHLALHYWYGNIDLSDGSIMSILLKTADKKYLKELTNFIGFRLYKSKAADTEEAHIKKLMALWEKIVLLTQQDSTKAEALEEFGTWFASRKFDPEWALEKLTHAAVTAGTIHLDFAALEYMETLTGSYPEESLKALSAMIDGTRERWAVSSWSKHATAIIQSAFNSNNATVKESAKALANKLVAKGYTEYRNVIIVS